MKYFYFPIRVFLLCLIFASVSAQSSDQNYVLSRTYKTRSTSILTGDKYWGSPSEVQTQISYIDGLGKTSQTVIVSGNPTNRDMVARVGYNNMYRQEKEYLPVAVNASNGNYVANASGAYYNSAAVGTPTTNFWTETKYDNSPLGRTSEQIAPGISTGVRKYYQVNNYDMHGDIRRYGVNADGVLTEADPYPDNSLNVTRTEDENSKKVEEFIDGNGRVILKRVDLHEYTYYVYDAKGQLRYVLQPEFQNGSAAFSIKLPLYAFHYTYDAQGRMLSKRVPGQNTFYMEYYDTDMLKYMIDGEGHRFYYKYDNLNRQTEMGTGVLEVSEKPLVKTKYDNYDNITNDFDNELGLADDNHFKGNPKTDSKKGLVTMISTRVLDAADGYGDTWLNTVTFYDKKGRVIQIQRQLYDLGGDSKERVSYKLDFTGNILEERTQQWTSSIPYRMDKSYTYDHQSRLLSIDHQFMKTTP